MGAKQESFNKEVGNNINYGKDMKQIKLKKTFKRSGNQENLVILAESFSVMKAELVQVEKEADGQTFQGAYL